MMDFADVDDDNEFEVFYGHDDNVQASSGRSPSGKSQVDVLLQGDESPPITVSSLYDYNPDAFCAESGDKDIKEMECSPWLSDEESFVSVSSFHRPTVARKKWKIHGVGNVESKNEVFGGAPYGSYCDSKDNQSRATCSLDDILNDVEMSEQREDTDPEYGANYVFCSGEKVMVSVQDTEKLRSTLFHRRYIRKCMDHFKKTWWRVLADSDIDDLCGTIRSETASYGSRFKFEPNTWPVAWEPDRLAELTTSTIQAMVCAALNSKRRLQLVIGLGSGRKLYQVAPNHIYYVEGDVVKETQDIDKARLTLLSDLKTKMSAPPSLFGASCDQCNVPISSWIFPTVSRLLKEFLVFSLSGAFLGLFARTQTGRVWARLSALRSFHLPR